MTSDLDRIVPLQEGGRRPALFCVHAVSGSAYAYAGLARLLGADRPVYGFEAPGFDNDRPPVRSLPALAAEYAATLREFQPAGPYRLLGWSLGGLLAFDMAKRLVAAGGEVTSLILVDAGLPRPMDLPPEREILHRFLQDMAGMSDHSPPGLDELSGTWPAEIDPATAFRGASESMILPEEIDTDLLTRQYTVFRTHLAAFYSATLDGAYPGPAVHILAAQSPAEDMRWGRLLPTLTEHVIPGTHHSIWTGESLMAMSDIIRRAL